MISDDDDVFHYKPLKRKKISSQISFTQNEKSKLKCRNKNLSTQPRNSSSILNSSLIKLQPTRLSQSKSALDKSYNGIENDKTKKEKDNQITSNRYSIPKNKFEVITSSGKSPVSIATISSCDSEDGTCCKTCQMPWKIYKQIGKSTYYHTVKCKTLNLDILKECPEKFYCKNTSEGHFWMKNHNLPSDSTKKEQQGITTLLNCDEEIPDLNINILPNKKDGAYEKISSLSELIVDDVEKPHSEINFTATLSAEKVESWLENTLAYTPPTVKPRITPVSENCKNKINKKLVFNEEENSKSSDNPVACIHFHFNVDQTSKKLVQTTLNNFLKFGSSSFSKNDLKKSPYQSNIEVEKLRADKNQQNVVEEWNKIFKSKKMTSINSSSSQVNFINKLGRCPFYKKIEDTSFVVDAFNYGYIEGISSYFLSHFHYDHYQGLHKTFSKNIYCSKITANLIEQQIKVQSRYINILPYEESRIIDGVEVTCYDANHCPGAVMFSFRLPTGKSILHVGDFRYNPSMESYSNLWNTMEMDIIYLDTTYLNCNYDFPSQDIILKKIRSISKYHMSDSRQKVVFFVGSYTIGKERVFKAIAQKLNCKIYAPPWKMKILKCIEDEEINERLTTNKVAATVHVVPMKDIHEKKLAEMLNNLGVKAIGVAIKPTGWNHNSNLADNINNLEARQVGNIYIYDIPYSEHSSFIELERFVKFVCPLKIIPTVNNGGARQRKEMEAILSKWTNDSRKSRENILSQTR